MKPFFRFSKQTNDIFSSQQDPGYRHKMWDFDYYLQIELLKILKSLASAEEISHLCIERWKQNLEQLAQARNLELEKLKALNQQPRYVYTARDELIIANCHPGTKFLYIGCGSGTECLRLAKRGYSVIGIDTDQKLVGIASRRAQYTQSSFSPICMDVYHLGFSAKAVDGFLLEFYGHHPSQEQTLNLQRELARILSESGTGIFVTSRKKYASYWYKMGSPYPAIMTAWLAKQAKLDFYATENDEAREILKYGLYSRSHTTESLALELSYAFQVLECKYEETDPRYVICTVKPKKRFDPNIPKEHYFTHYTPLAASVLHHTEVAGILNMIEEICEILESHETHVVRYFESVDDSQTVSPLRSVKPQLARFTKLVDEIL
jgi:SAM-dependent methyltransferase